MKRQPASATPPAEPETEPMSASPPPRPVMLVILDGWGWREERNDNAIRLARTPAFDRLWNSAPTTFLRTSGLDVGLPDGQMGNSEVGHMNIGAGRVVMQELPRIDAALQDGSVNDLPALRDFITALRQSGGTCHLFGLVSDGGVHAHQDHGAALAQILTRAGIRVAVHAFTDGRDTPPASARRFLTKFLPALPEGATLATLCGRFYAMDRDNRWDRVEKAYRMMVDAEGERYSDPCDAITDAYAREFSDEFIRPAVFGDYAGMKDGDGLLCFNFRSDRVRELLTALLDPAFQGFERPRFLHFSGALGMTRYSTELESLMQTLFPFQEMTNLLGHVVSAAGKRQLRMAETEKYPHVTYFLNGGEEEVLENEDRIMVPSPKVATYDLKPEMSAPELTEKAVTAIGSGQYDLIVLNFANPDMVGHTGSLEAAIRAVETVDTGLGRIVDAITAVGGALFVTADHGNCELMRDPDTGGPHTAHTTNLVPALLYDSSAPIGTRRLTSGKLADIAPTLLDLMQLPQPPEMTGQSLLA
ncbi:Phosphoglycerate mutase [Granulibacter bethesdensis CGDNIH1]|uniref:2,3-bisphosphoglycerate-independent phosphoglycerate mutase n=2 Tax=Granulibacter bethesdensis TaxID=364410 RepID=Q0BRE2_GRABC|nr:Phosphoglycerate mutase [Granulibacter bethesdensis CGDNIH1]APH52465.1 Phosphoglycerate mutase [Granulibacter bethesdensis]APH65154.1 Phosphoglycerate mutase [Granulibacter bethesdensis]